jgi:hypothetical protein
MDITWWRINLTYIYIYTHTYVLRPNAWPGYEMTIQPVHHKREQSVALEILIFFHVKDWFYRFSPLTPSISFYIYFISFHADKLQRLLKLIEKKKKPFDATWYISRRACVCEYSCGARARTGAGFLWLSPRFNPSWLPMTESQVQS